MSHLKGMSFSLALPTFSTTSTLIAVVVGVVDDIASVSSPVVSFNGAKKCARDYSSVSTECKSVL